MAAEHRDRLVELISLWYVEAGKYGVLPLDGRAQQRFAEERPQIAEARESYVYYPGTQAVPGTAAVSVLNRSYTITADVELPEPGVVPTVLDAIGVDTSDGLEELGRAPAKGVLFSHGGIEGGYSLFVLDGHLHYAYNHLGRSLIHLRSGEPIPTGRRVALRYEFERTGQGQPRQGKGAPGVGRLFFDDAVVGEVTFDVTIPLLLGLGGGVTAGREEGSPICGELYTPPFPFTGTLHSVTVNVGREHLTPDPEAEMRIIMARQ